jgi:hypothetical protein
MPLVVAFFIWVKQFVAGILPYDFILFLMWIFMKEKCEVIRTSHSVICSSYARTLSG